MSPHVLNAFQFVYQIRFYYSSDDIYKRSFENGIYSQLNNFPINYHLYAIDIHRTLNILVTDIIRVTKRYNEYPYTGHVVFCCRCFFFYPCPTLYI